MRTNFLLCLLLMSILACKNEKKVAIDRKALVSRHHIAHDTIDSLNTLSVGNGNFAFSVDITGLQTFPEYYQKGIPLGTMSNWGWHSEENTQDYNIEQVKIPYQVGGKTVNYVHDFRNTEDTLKANASLWLRENPHRLQLAYLGFQFTNDDGSKASIDNIAPVNQQLLLWEGKIVSEFQVNGIPVTVTTICHPEDDLVAIQVKSILIEQEKLALKLTFPPVDKSWRNIYSPDTEEPYPAVLEKQNEGQYSFSRHFESSSYYAQFDMQESQISSIKPNEFIFAPDTSQKNVEFSLKLSHDPIEVTNPEFSLTDYENRIFWESFWNGGGAIDFSLCTDARAFELERRVILSQYLSQIQTSGNLPPMETGLTYNSWYGKFHLEMHWWHSLHYALWNKKDVLEKQMIFYDEILDKAISTAEMQGYDGARWPKMIGPKGNESPSGIGTYLIWQQPHYIYFAETLFKNSEDSLAVLNTYDRLITYTADFMASYANYDSTSRRYVLGPALIPAQERFSPITTINPAFELVYWHWGLSTAIRWKKRQQKEVPALWQEVVDHFSTLTDSEGVYLFTEDAADSYTNDRYLTDHPMILGCVGLLPPSPLIDQQIMANTYELVKEKWHWEDTWGWDFPMSAMAAGNLGKYDEAVDFLLMDIMTNTYLMNGHNYQDPRLTIYLPGNGGLLTAVAQMCTKNQFPKNGQWDVKWEKLGKGL